MNQRKRILYAIQGTGNGHLSRATEIIPLLKKRADVDILISGTQTELTLPFQVKYRFHGLSFVFGKNGGIDLLSTFKKSRLRELLKEIKKLPVEEYDFVINDFEPISAWACRATGVPCIGLSHQAAVLHEKAPKPKKKDRLAQFILKHYAPCDKHIGFHFQSYDKEIFTPVIRSGIRNAAPKKNGHFTVYLPAYGDEKIISILGKINTTRWEVFSKHALYPRQIDNIWIFPVNEHQFTESLLQAEGILCGAGFETPAEAIFLRKKLMVIPMKGQYEQQCNAEALRKINVPVIKKLSKKNIETIENWTKTPVNSDILYKDITEEVIDKVFRIALEMTTLHLVEKKPNVIQLIPDLPIRQSSANNK